MNHKLAASIILNAYKKLVDRSTLSNEKLHETIWNVGDAFLSLPTYACPKTILTELLNVMFQPRDEALHVEDVSTVRKTNKQITFKIKTGMGLPVKIKHQLEIWEMIEDPAFKAASFGKMMGTKFIELSDEYKKAKKNATVSNLFTFTDKPRKQRIS